MNKVSFEEMPQLVAALNEKIDRVLDELKERNQPRSDTKGEPMIGIEEAARILNLAVSTVYKLTQQKRIPYYQPAKQLLFKNSELQEWLENGRMAEATNSFSDMRRDLSIGNRRKPKSKW